MYNKQHQAMVQEAVRPRFRGSQPLKSKVVPRYPESAEREFQRVTRAYLKLLRDSLKDHLPAIMAAYKKERRGDSRFDDAQDLNREVRAEMQKVAEDLEQKIAAFGLYEFVEKVGKMTQKASLREWKRVIRETLGIDLMDDYYKGDFYAEALRRWVDENVLKIKSIPTETLGNMQQLILDGFVRGMPMRDIQKAIQKEYGTTKSKAVLLARDQVSTLNAQISRQQQQDAGCSKYRWSDSRDGRVRDCHRSLDGKIFSWDNPPEMWYITKKSGKVMTGRRCHPGEDYCCRCVAIPVFDIDTLDIPMKSDN